jgi:hypothetical protein
MSEIEDKIKYYKDIIKESDKLIVEAKELMQHNLNNAGNDVAPALFIL